MKKLRLDIDALRVDSFRTGAGARGGTVAANMDPTSCFTIPGEEYPRDPSLHGSCDWYTCFNGCLQP